MITADSFLVSCSEPWTTTDKIHGFTFFEALWVVNLQIWGWLEHIYSSKRLLLMCLNDLFRYLDLGGPIIAGIYPRTTPKLHNILVSWRIFFRVFAQDGISRFMTLVPCAFKEWDESWRSRWAGNRLPKGWRFLAICLLYLRAELDWTKFQTSWLQLQICWRIKDQRICAGEVHECLSKCVWSVS